MLTGDMKRVADKVAEELEIGEVYSELLPADKVAKVEQLLSQNQRKKSLRSSETESMMRRYCREQISELPWVHSDQMQQSRQQTLS